MIISEKKWTTVVFFSLVSFFSLYKQPDEYTTCRNFTLWLCRSECVALGKGKGKLSHIVRHHIHSLLFFLSLHTLFLTHNSYIIYFFTLLRLSRTEQNFHKILFHTITIFFISLFYLATKVHTFSRIMELPQRHIIF